MRFARFQVILAAVFFATTGEAQVTVHDATPIFFTNETVIANGSNVLWAVCSGESQKVNVQPLIGSQVAFVGGSYPLATNADLVLLSMYTKKFRGASVEIEISPPRDVRPHSKNWTAEVLGTLQSVDFKNRVIRIRAKAEDWRVRDTSNY